MGKGDIKTKKGKRQIGSFGKSRPHKVKKAEGPKKETESPKKETESSEAKVKD